MVNWPELKNKFPSEIVDHLERLFERGGPFVISARELAAQSNCSPLLAQQLLHAVSPPLSVREVVRCPQCAEELRDGEAAKKQCDNCDCNFSDFPKSTATVLFSHNAPPTRDVAWALALHGMNTRGDWQEEFNWRLSTSYKRSVPVAIYKYGIVRPSVLSRWSLVRLEKRLLEKIQHLQGRTQEAGFGTPPDIIAHSLGTWLIGHTLQRNPSLRIGRLILTGCILRPDFDWRTLIANGQVEAVLNHYGSKDFWAAAAQFVIPDSGPSGRLGFSGNLSIVQVRADEFGHSDYFSDRKLPVVFEEVWRPFLSNPSTKLHLLNRHEPTVWRETIWPFRATFFRFGLFFLWWFFVAFGLTCLVLGLRLVAQLLLRRA